MRETAAAGSTQQHHDWTPPTHVGVLYRQSYTADRGVLQYQRLGSTRTFKLCYDGSYRQFAVRKEVRRSTLGGNGRTETTTVYPEDGMVNVDGPTAAARRMVEYLREEVATFDIPEQVNGWQKLDGTPTIAYRTPYHTAELRVVASNGRYDTVLEDHAGDTTVVTASVPGYQPALAALTNYMTCNDPKDHTLPDELRVESAYADFRRSAAGLGELIRFEHPDGYRVRVVAEDSSRTDQTYTVQTSLGDRIQGLPGERVGTWAERFAEELAGR